MLNNDVAKNNLLIALLGIAIAGIGFGLVTPVAVILLEKNNTPGYITGLITMIGYFAIFVFSPVAGKLYNRYNLKRILMMGMMLWLIGAAGHIFWRNLIILIIVKIIMGIGGTLVFIGTEVLINYCSNENNRGKNIGLYATLLSAGIAIGTLFIWTVEIADYFPFLLGSLIMLFVTFFIQIKFNNLFLGNEHYQTKNDFTFFKMPVLGVFSAFIYGLFESSVVVALPLYALRLNFTQNEVSYLLASFVVGGIILLYFISRIADFYSKYNMILLISMLLFVLLVFPIFFNSLLFLLVLLFFIGGVIPAFYTVGLSYTAEKVEYKHITFANSYYIMMYGLGTLVGPVFGSLLVEWNLRIGYWLISSVLCLLFFMVFFLLKLISKFKPQK